MESKQILALSLAMALGVTAGDMMLSKRGFVGACERKRRRRRKGSDTSRKISASKKNFAAGMITTPREVLEAIRSTQPDFHFKVATKAGKPVVGDPVKGGIDGSRSVSSIGWSGLFSLDTPFADQQVELKNDFKLVKLLFKRRRIVKKERKNYKRELMYFELDVPDYGTIRFYLGKDPYP